MISSGDECNGEGHVVASEHGKKRDVRRMLVIAGSAILLIAIVFSVRYVVIKNRDAYIGKAFERLAEAQSYNVITDLELRLPVQLRGKERPVQKVLIHLESDAAWRQESVEVVGALDIEARGRGMVLFTNGDFYIYPEKIAFYLDELPTLLNPSGNLLKKWTYVEVPILQVQNRDELRVAMRNFFQGWIEVADDTSQDKDVPQSRHFRRELTPEQESILAAVFRQARSGNRALHIIARLLWAFEVRSVDVWVDKGSKEISKLAVEFVHPERKEEGATLTLAFSDYGKKVQLTKPPQELTVRPEAFTDIFGGGEVSGIE